jgi:arylsulfatase A-like enzyme
VWGNKHNAVSYKKVRPNHALYPCLFKRIKEHKPAARCSSVVNWPDINQRMVPEADFKAKGANDAQVAEIAAKHLVETNPDAVFIQFDEVDGAGESSQFSVKSQKYIQQIEKTDGYIGELLAALKKRKTYADEEWLIIVTTDHGGKGNTHGGDSPEERRIFIITSGPGAKRGEVSPGPGIVAVAPTAMKYLGVAIKPEWNLDGQPFGLKD